MPDILTNEEKCVLFLLEANYTFEEVELLLQCDGFSIEC